MGSWFRNRRSRQINVEGGVTVERLVTKSIFWTAAFLLLPDLFLHNHIGQIKSLVATFAFQDKHSPGKNDLNGLYITPPSESGVILSDFVPTNVNQGCGFKSDRVLGPIPASDGVEAYTYGGKARIIPFTTGNPFLGTILLGFSIGRGSGALKGLRPVIRD